MLNGGDVISPDGGGVQEAEAERRVFILLQRSHVCVCSPSTPRRLLSPQTLLMSLLMCCTCVAQFVCSPFLFIFVSVVLELSSTPSESIHSSGLTLGGQVEVCPHIVSSGSSGVQCFNKTLNWLLKPPSERLFFSSAVLLFYYQLTQFHKTKDDFTKALSKALHRGCLFNVSMIWHFDVSLIFFVLVLCFRSTYLCVGLIDERVVNW